MYGLGKPRTKLGRWIDQNNISQLDLADYTGVSRNTISQLCNNEEYEPYEETIIKVIRGLRRMGYDVSVSDFW